MPVQTLAALVARAIAEGLDPRTPALAIARATRPDQARGRRPDRRIAEASRRPALPGPVLVMLGQVFGEQPSTQSSVRRAGQKAG